LADHSEPVVYSVWDADRVEFGVERIWRTAVELVRQTCRTAAIEPHHVSTIALTSQAQTFALFDDSGTPLSPFISWIDTRAAEQAALLQEKLGHEFHIHCSFAPPIAELQVAKVLWLKQHAPELLDRAASILPLPTWLTLRLAGINAVDHNLAAMSGLYSLRTGGWWSQALDLCALGEGQLPALVDVGVHMRAQRACPGLSFPGDLEIVFAGNDQTCGALANNCRYGEIVATLGTALVAYRFTGHRPGPYSDNGCWGPYPGGGFYELAVRSQGCAALDWAREQLMPQEDIEGFVTCARSVHRDLKARDSVRDKVYFFPDQMGTPSAWSGPHDQAHRALAVLEGIGFALRQLVFDDLQGEAGLTSITVIGGGSKSGFWLQLLANILGRPVRRGRGDSLLGAAMIALPDVVPPQSSAFDTFVPDESSTAYYRKSYQVWTTGLNGNAA
jgi:xylulokinase